LRRALRPSLPALAHYFGIRWEHIEVMPHAELLAYLDAIPEQEG
jgi:hypothetical protein